MKKIFLFFIILILAVGCGKTPIPKPYGYFRVDLPPHDYRRIDTLQLPFSFDISKSAVLVSQPKDGEKYWVDIFYPSLNAGLYCSYKSIGNNLASLLEDTRRIVYKHSVRADGITEKTYENKDEKVYGILYDLKGNTASSLQFVLTDSTRHFFRAALYFNNVPNKDSIAPMAQYVREDVIRMVESFRWKK